MVKFDYDKTYRKGRLITDESTLKFIRNHFSIKDKNAAFVNRKSFGRKIPDRKYAVQATGLFDLGLLQEIRKFIVEKNLGSVEHTQQLTDRLNCSYSSQDVFDGLKYPARYYGVETVSEALKIGCGTIVWGTGGGKSFCMAQLVETIYRNDKNLKCLIVVPGTSLVNQLIQDFTEYEVSFSYSGWTGKLKLQDTNIIILNSENLNAKFGANKWITDVDLLLVDEVHRSHSNSNLAKLINKIKTPNKFGFTGTLPPDNLDLWKVIGTFGPVIYEKSSKELRDEGFISDVSIRILKLIHPKRKKMNYQDEIKYLVEHEGRNKIIRNLVKKLDKNCLILVNTLDHGHILSKLLQFEGKETVFIHGEMSVDERDVIKSRMEIDNNIICIAMSSIFSTGISIKNIHYILFVAGGKSFIRIIQSIGRGLRLHSDKSRLILFDVCDDLKYSDAHLEERKIFYDNEQIQFKETSINLL